MFFSGDSGYFDGFKIIGERFGPFDITLLENGAYNRAWADIHMHPEETIQAHFDLRGKRLVPIHNGTFDLSIHVRLDAAGSRERHRQSAWRAIEHATQMGERFDLSHPVEGTAWWSDRKIRAASVDFLLPGQRLP